MGKTAGRFKCDMIYGFLLQCTALKMLGRSVGCLLEFCSIALIVSMSLQRAIDYHLNDLMCTDREAQ